MSTATLPAATTPKTLQITFTPLGEKKEITLTPERVRQFLCVPTKSGQMPSYEQVIKYMMLCQAQSLNPWVNDAYLVGYDSKDGPSFSLITSHQAILKRAEASDKHDGLESGVVVKSGDKITERQGKIVHEGEKLIGGWCRVHRKDRSIPSYDSVQFSTYNTNRSRWSADPSGMIVKVAEAAALRKTYPSNLAALYCQEEMDGGDRPESAVIQGEMVTPKAASRVEQVKRSITQTPEPAQEPIEPEPAVDLSEQIDAVRKSLLDAEPDHAKRVAIYKTNGINSPGEDAEFDQFTIDSLWAAIEELNEEKRQ